VLHRAADLDAHRRDDRGGPKGLRIGDTENAVASELILVENWSEELRGR